MQIEDALDQVTEMLESDPTLSYREAFQRFEMIKDFEKWNPINETVH